MLEIFIPVRDFGQHIRHDLHRASLNRQIELLPARFARTLQFAGHFPRQQRPLARVGRVGWHRGRALLGVAEAGVLVPGERVVNQRLAVPEVIEPREPGGFREEFVDARRR